MVVKGLPDLQRRRRSSGLVRTQRTRSHPHGVQGYREAGKNAIAQLATPFRYKANSLTLHFSSRKFAKSNPCQTLLSEKQHI